MEDRFSAQNTKNYCVAKTAGLLTQRIIHMLKIYWDFNSRLTLEMYLPLFSGEE